MHVFMLTVADDVRSENIPDTSTMSERYQRTFIKRSVKTVKVT